MVLPRKNSSGAWARLAETGRAARITAARPQTSFPMGINDALRSPGLAHHCSGPNRPRKRGRVHSRVTIARTAAIAYDQLVPVSRAWERRHVRSGGPFEKEHIMTGVVTAPGMGHNQPDPLEMEKKNQKWDRWAKKRTFVRALEGTYSHLYKTLKEEKRVYSAQDVPWKGGPQMFGKSVISPQATSIIQSIESHI